MAARLLDRLADSVQYDERTKKSFFAMPLTEKMTMPELFAKLGELQRDLGLIRCVHSR